uniref:EamA domain-containing protein n=1 Tax=viral metagenome TaxID=1070528 RepID=A0A6C0AK82_9ZZZZ
MIRDAVDGWIASVDWKVGRFNLLPAAFGVVMAILDVVMMASGKMVHTGTLSYGFALPLATVAYALQPYLFIKAMNYESMIVTNLIWNLMSDIVITLIGLFYFGETIGGVRWVALLMSLFAILLFAYTEK